MERETEAEMERETKAEEEAWTGAEAEADTVARKFRGGPNRRPKIIGLKLAYLCLKLELAALLWTVFISHAYLQAYATGIDKSEI